MIRQSWRTQLKAAAEERDVLAIVRHFLAEWTKGEIAALPAGAWPSRISSREDVLSHAVTLAELHGRFDGAAGGLPGLQELLLFFTHAAVRIAKIAAPALDPPDPPAPKRRRRNGRTSRKRRNGHAARGR
jgi:hypothetical protein